MGGAPKTIDECVKLIRDGDLALPEFQRRFRWPLDYKVDLIRSILRDWPIGSILMLEQVDPARRLQPRKIEGAPACNKTPRYLVLDGQQRLTTLYQAYESGYPSNGEAIFYIDLEALLADEEALEDAVDALSPSEFKKTFGATSDFAPRLIVPLSFVRVTQLWNDWLQHVPEERREQVNTLKDNKLSKLTNYVIREEVISNTLPIEAIAKIFERTNRNVQRLDAFDLMVAILFPYTVKRKHYNLRAELERVRGEHQELDEFGIPGLEILKVLALREHLSQKAAARAAERSANKAAKQPSMKVKGIRQSDVLALEPKTVIENWDSAAAAMANAVRFLREECGVLRGNLVPQDTMLIPVADIFFAKPDLEASDIAKLRRWFFASAFTRRFARGANTQAVSQAEVLRDWVLANGAVPDEIRDFRIETSDFSSIAADGGTEILVKGTIAALARRGACDWQLHDQEAIALRDLDSSIDLQIHHVFAQNLIAERKNSPIHNESVPANQVLISASFNGSIRNQAPSAVLGDRRTSSTAISSHDVDISSLKSDDFNQFVAARSAKLRELAQSVVQS